jgi:glycerol-3-phosphate dehydrogenase
MTHRDKGLPRPATRESNEPEPAEPNSSNSPGRGAENRLPEAMTPLSTRVLVIGGGATGTGLARDLALRGVPSILVDQGDLNAGASGANHGLLHSGARYVAGDPESARHCYEEGQILRRLGPHCVEDTNGLFVAVEGDDEHYVADFPTLCARCGIPTRALDLAEARALEPAVSPKMIAAYEVPDATVDPFKLSLENMAHACSLGSALLTQTRVVGFDLRDGRITGTRVVDMRSGQERSIVADEVVNAAGAWSGQVAALAGITLEILYSKGTLLITQRRVTQRVVNRLRKPSNADIIVPGGTVSVLGTTSLRVDSLDDIAPTIPEVDTIVSEASILVPALATARILRAYAGVRPLVQQGSASDDRAVSRDLSLFDHRTHGVHNFVTVTGGKLTTFRQMAEKAADVVCDHLGVTEPCRTTVEPLPESSVWTVPGRSPRVWADAADPKDLFLCECEMVPQSAIDRIVEGLRHASRVPTLRDIGLRSRVGKGACQGSFCSLRVLAHLYQHRTVDAPEGLDDLRSFLLERWKGERAILWDTQLRQAELQEAMHCALLGLELERP